MSDNGKIVEVVRFIFKTCVQGTNYTKVIITQKKHIFG